MYPNIIFFLIDGIRADQCYGKDRSSKTPNIDSLIKNGVYFEQAISSADGTITSLNTVFSSKFQFSHPYLAIHILTQLHSSRHNLHFCIFE